MDAFFDLLLTSTMRIGRVRFVLGAVVLAVLWATFDLLVHGRLFNALAWVVAPIVLFSGACVLSQRLHDLGRSGWWCWPVLLALAVTWPSQGLGLLNLLAAGAVAPVLLALALVPGSRQLNRHGPPVGAVAG